MSALDLEVSYHLARYSTGEESLAEFRHWLLPFVWDLAEPDSSFDSQLARRVELRLAEFLNGHWTEDDLRAMFQEMVLPTSGIVPTLMETVLSGARETRPTEPLRTPSEFVPA